MPIYGILILQSIRCSPTLWAVTQPSQFRSIMDKDEFVREPQISLYITIYISSNSEITDRQKDKQMDLQSFSLLVTIATQDM